MDDKNILPFFYKTRYSMSFKIEDNIYIIPKGMEIKSINFDRDTSKCTIQYDENLTQILLIDFDFIKRNFVKYIQDER